MKTIELDRLMEIELLATLLMRRNEIECIIEQNGALDSVNASNLGIKLRSIEKLIEQVKGE